MAASEKCEWAPWVAGSVRRADLESEQPLGHDGDEHHASGERDLDHRHRRQGEGSHVQAPAQRGHQHAQGEPLGGVQAAGGAQRMTDVDLLDRTCAPVLVEEPQVRHEGAEESEQDSEF
jgi:hypothetical protein